MEKIGVLVVAYGQRGAAMADVLYRSPDHRTRLFIVDKQCNPLCSDLARISGGKHVVIPSLNVRDITRFAQEHQEDIDFGIIGPEDPIVAGVKDSVEVTTGIPIICPSRELALEESKVRQRRILSEVAPELNPRYMVFDPSELTEQQLRDSFYDWAKKLDYQIAVKPDGLVRGKGVGVWGDHFETPEAAFEHFWSIVGNHGIVLVEEKVVGEEWSGQYVSDGRDIVPTSAIRDFKRAFDGDEGPNVGGMGCYMDTGDLLPFMTKFDWTLANQYVQRLFEHLKDPGRNRALMGVPFYMAWVATGDGLKLFEINSRWGMSEGETIIPTFENFMGLCLAIVEGKLEEFNDGLGSIRRQPLASVAVNVVPPQYGGLQKEYSGSMLVDLSGAYRLKEDYCDRLQIYPGSLELMDDGRTRALGSRTVCVVGLRDTIEEARGITYEAANAVKDHSECELWFREDIGSPDHIRGSVKHMDRLRSKYLI